MNKKQNLSSQTFEQTKNSLDSSSKRFLAKCRKQIKEFAQKGRVKTNLKINSSKTQSYNYLSSLAISFLKKEGFKVKRLEDTYKSSKGNISWISNIEVSW